MINRLRPSATLTDKTDRCCKDALPPLPCLYRSGEETPSCPDAFYSVDDRDRGIASKYEVTVHAVGKVDGVSVLVRGLGNG